MNEPSKLDTGLERLAEDKHSILLGLFISYEEKSVMNTAVIIFKVYANSLVVFLCL
jgi:hypothetical protein